MQYKNFRPHKEIKRKQNIFTNSGNTEQTNRKNLFTKHVNRKSDFNLSDDEITINPRPLKSYKLSNKNATPDFKKYNEKLEHLVQNIPISKSYSTIEEKHKLLENLDNSNVTKRDDLRLDRPIIEGTCQDMCPEKERYLRECQDIVSIFERDENNQFDHRRAVKEYGRCSIDQKESQPHDLRPTEVLERTMNYLLTHIVDTLDLNVSWYQWYQFLCGRTRSIRKDITQQNLYNETIVSIMESITRFHIFCAAWLCEESKDLFDSRNNDDHLKNCLQTLKNMYADMPIDSCPNESEFRSYMIVLNLDKGEMLDEAQKLTSSVFHSSKLRFAISVYQAVSTNNYVRFFRLLDQSDLVLSCLLHRFIVPMRLRAFEVINKVYMTNKCQDYRANQNQLPLSTVLRQLKFENDEELLEFCEQINQKSVVQSDNTMIVLQPLNLRLTRRPALTKKSIMLVETKQGNRKLSVIFNGDQAVSDVDCGLRECRMVSFDSQGYYTGTKQVPTTVAAVITEDESSSSIVADEEEDIISIVSSDEEAQRLEQQQEQQHIYSKDVSQLAPSLSTRDHLPAEPPQQQPRWSQNIFTTNTTPASASWSNLFPTQAANTSNLFANVTSSHMAMGNLFASPSSTPPTSNLFLQRNDPLPSLSPGREEPRTKLLFPPSSPNNGPSINIPKPSPVVVVVPREPIMSKADITQFAGSTIDQLISEIIEAESDEYIHLILENEKFRKLEIDKIQDGLCNYLVREVVTELAKTNNTNKRIVSANILNDFAEEMVDKQMHEISKYIEEKKHKAKLQTFNQMKFYFKRWCRYANASIKARKSLINLPAAPRMADDFTVCEEICGKVRKISTDWFVSGDVSWLKHPIIHRLEQQVTRDITKPSIGTKKRNSGAQTVLSYHNKMCVNVGEYIRNFVQSRFINVLDCHKRVLEVASKIDPAPEIIICDYNRLIEEMLAQLESKINVPYDLFKLKLPIVHVPSNIPNDWRAYLDKIFTDLGLRHHQKSHFVKEACEMTFQLLQYNENVCTLSCFHIRLVPWIDIIKKAVINRLDEIDHRVSDFDVEIETNGLSVVRKLQMESIAEEMTVAECIDKCKLFQRKFESRQISPPKLEISKRSSMFSTFWNKVCQLQMKIDECKENSQ